MAELEGLIDEMEWEAKQVAISLYETRNAILDALQPDGRPWGFPKRTNRDQLREYVQNLRGNEMAWENWIRERALGNIQRMTEQGIDAQSQASVSPFDIAIRHGYWYSSRMEKALKREEGKISGDRSNGASPVSDDSGGVPPPAPEAPDSPDMVEPEQEY